MGLYEGIKDVAKVVQQADNIKLYQQLLDLSAQALDMQSEINRLTAENAELRKQKDIESKIQRHSEPIINLSGETDIVYCSHCWDNEKKLIQVSTNKNNGEFICPHCRFEGVYDEELRHDYLEKRKPKPRGPRFSSI